MSTAFIIGSPRSGTTVLGNIINCHRQIAQWYEPYYMWSFFIGTHEDDVWDPGFLTPRARMKIVREYQLYRKKSGKDLIVEKTPGHAFHIRLINEVFPEAKWIHLLRDGRDATLSIHREWNKRAAMVNNQNYRQLIATARKMLIRQPYFKYRLMAVVHEFLTSRSVNPRMYLNKAKWKGQPYWGPRFKGWETFIAGHTHLEFNAMQWVKSVEAAREGLEGVSASNRMEIRYEHLLADPEKTLTAVLEFLGYRADPEFFSVIPKLRPENTRKWMTAFSPAEIELIKPILTPLLEKTGYLRESPW